LHCGVSWQALEKRLQTVPAAKLSRVVYPAWSLSVNVNAVPQRTGSDEKSGLAPRIFDGEIAVRFGGRPPETFRRQHGESISDMKFPRHALLVRTPRLMENREFGGSTRG
jgi:hypothetical protein